MWAARVLGWPRVGLGNILEENFGVRMSKRWQRHNWGSRPLSSEALAYARLDTHYLLPLRGRMLDELQAMGRLEEAREFFVKVAQSEPTFTAFDPDVDLWKVKGVWDLDSDSWAVLRELLIWRDQEARRRDRPHFKIVNDRVLTGLAVAKPKSIDQIRGIKGFKRHHRRRYGHKIVQAVARGLEASPPRRPPRSPRPPEEVTERYEALRSWRKKVAALRGVDPDVVVSNATLRELAHQVPHSLDQLRGLDVLGPWKQRKYGRDLLRVLRKCC
jgi:ribonuclease D